MNSGRWNSATARWLNIGLRCAHLIGVAGVGGGFLFALPEAQWLGYWRLALASGGALALLYLWTDFGWLRQLKGQAVMAKLGLLALAGVLPAWRGELFMLIVVLSGSFAHAPARVRGYVWGRKK